MVTQLQMYYFHATKLKIKKFIQNEYVNCKNFEFFMKK
jgi:hypothetical protein